MSGAHNGIEAGPVSLRGGPALHLQDRRKEQAT